MSAEGRSKGWVYSWVVPVPVEVEIADGNKAKYHLVKVGKTEAHTLLNRLYTQQLAWRKILNKAEAGDIKIPFHCSVEMNVDGYLARLNFDDFPDMLTLSYRWPSSRTADETERFLRALLGPPFPSQSIHEMIKAWDESWTQKRPGEKKPAKPR